MSVSSSIAGFLGVFALSLGLTGAVLRYARRRLLDVPNARSSHRVPTPRGGGLAIVLALLGGEVYWRLVVGEFAIGFAVLAGGVLVAAVGFWDDHGHLSARWRLLAHLAAAALAVASLPGDMPLRLGPVSLGSGAFADFIGVLVIAWMLNLFNFMDGIDGLAGLEVVSVGASATLLLLLSLPSGGALPVAPGLLAAATLGFLAWNWPPAKIFMGDVGSGFVGYLLGCEAIATAKTGTLGLAVWLILAGVFVVDASFTLVRRMTGGQRWYEAHRSHAYQHAARRLGGHAPVDHRVLAINLLWLLPMAGFVVWNPALELPLLILAYLPLLCLAIRLRAGQPGL
ncbi:MraY family glycosyltransferase [Methylococcus capsulatus]|uniref:MraY family glycosyltransferase n=1 Tax=Methylococcus capsulatus TaxID=414 RepID=UPI001C53055D|nr:glycosyltransferase family 4 protein [Methylococcus capsulatus]QXP88343.1 glycosyltransferase family 4 protein [Methylococcus capsulatus]QXP94649.1 glycosyltransferase family 4 protein [Methylococcus capsulatus]UQN13382.1 glycosyltransferase family 4 protein [Methylococcus capsulatus]